MKKNIKKFLALLTASAIVFNGMSNFSLNANAKAFVTANSPIVVYDTDHIVLQEGGFDKATTSTEIPVNEMVESNFKFGFSTLTMPASASYSDETLSGFEETVLDGWSNHSSTIDISKCKIKTADLKSLYFGLLNDNPKYFQVDNTYSYYYSGDYATKILVSYKYNKTQSDSMLEEYEAEISKVIADADKNWSDFEKALYINNYLTLNVAYDESYSRYSAYDVFVNKSAVCQGYSLAFNELASRLGLTSVYVSSDALCHAWNLVKINGSYYHVDSTWNDPVSNVKGRSRHYYFLKSSSFFNSTDGKHQATDWTFNKGLTASDASNTLYDNSEWSDIDCGFFYIDGYWYTIDKNNGGLAKYSCNSTNLNFLKTLYNLDNKWPAQTPGYYYPNMEKLACINKELYYSTPNNIYRITPDNTTPELFYSLNAEQANLGYIYGLEIDIDGNIDIDIGQTQSSLTTNRIGYIEPDRVIEPPTQAETTTEKQTTTNQQVTTEKQTTTSQQATTEKQTTTSQQVTTEKQTTTSQQATTEKQTTTSQQVTTEKQTTTEQQTTSEQETTHPYTHSISSCDISLSEDYYTYDGTEKKPVVLVLDEYGYPVDNANYSVTYSNNVNAGTGSAAITGKGIYTGQVIKTFIIEKASQKLEASVPTNTIKIGNTVQISTDGIGDIYFESTDKDILTVDSNGICKGISKGNATVSIVATGDSNHKPGIASIDLTVIDTDISEDLIDISTLNIKFKSTGFPFTYNGSEIKPIPVVRVADDVNAEVLTENVDYNVSYSNNINAGKGYVTITCIGKYTGSKTFGFTIEKAIQNLSVTIGDDNKKDISLHDISEIYVDGIGEITITSSDTDVAEIIVNSIVPRSVGSTVLTITANGDDNHLAATVTLQITIYDEVEETTTNTGETTSLPGEDFTTKPVETSSLPDEDFTTKPVETSSVPGEDFTTKAGETSSVPGEDFTIKPVETTSVPDEAFTTKPVETSSVPGEDFTTKPAETTSNQRETTSSQRETTTASQQETSTSSQLETTTAAEQETETASQQETSTATEQDTTTTPQQETTTQEPETKPEPQKKDIKYCTVTFDKTKYTYTGTNIYPKLKLKYSYKYTANGSTYTKSVSLSQGSDYTVKYANNKNVGTAKIYIYGLGEYCGTKNVTFKINKATNSISNLKATYTFTSSTTSTKTFTISAKAKFDKLTYTASDKKIKINAYGKVYIPRNYSGIATITLKSKSSSNYSPVTKKITLKINPAATKITKLTKFNSKDKCIYASVNKNLSSTGYTIQYSPSRSFKSNVKSITLKNSVVTAKLSGLQKNKTYYIRIRAYKTSKTKLYSSWSTVKTIKTK